MSRKNLYDDSWHQTELQWLEDGINIFLHEIRCLVCNLFALACLIVQAIWTVGQFIARRFN